MEIWREDKLRARRRRREQRIRLMSFIRWPIGRLRLIRGLTRLLRSTWVGMLVELMSLGLVYPSLLLLVHPFLPCVVVWRSSSIP